MASAQGGGGESTKKASSKKVVTNKKNSGTTPAGRTPPKPPTSPVPTRTPAPSTTREQAADRERQYEAIRIAGIATVAAQTATKEIGKYRYMPEEKSDGKIHNPLSPPPPRRFGTITLTDASIIFDEPPIDRSQKKTFRFFDTRGSSLSRGIVTYSDWLHGDRKKISVSWTIGSDTIAREFETPQERDRFFDDLKRTYQEWKTKYAPFQFAEGTFDVDDRCKLDDRIVPCSAATPSGTEGESPSPTRKPVFETPTYRVTVESLARNANNYTANLVFENLTEETINIGWEEKSNLLPDATGPYLIDESGEKYFADGTDSGNIISDGMTWLWESHTGILPKTKLTSRFKFSGNGNGSTFTLIAKEMQGLGTEPVTIEGLKIGIQTELPLSTPSVSPAPTGAASSGGDDIDKIARLGEVSSEPTRAPSNASGETIRIAIKHLHGYGFFSNLCSGNLILQNGFLEFSSFSNPKENFRVPVSKIYELAYEEVRYAHGLPLVPRIHTKVGIPKDNNKEDKKNYNFLPDSATMAASPPYDSLLPICPNCEDEVGRIYRLISIHKAH